MRAGSLCGPVRDDLLRVGAVCHSPPAQGWLGFGEPGEPSGAASGAPMSLFESPARAVQSSQVEGLTSDCSSFDGGRGHPGSARGKPGFARSWRPPVRSLPGRGCGSKRWTSSGTSAGPRRGSALAGRHRPLEGPRRFASARSSDGRTRAWWCGPATWSRPREREIQMSDDPGDTATSAGSRRCRTAPGAPVMKQLAGAAVRPFPPTLARARR